MSIRRKVLLLCLLTAVGVLALLLAGARTILLERFNQLEQDQARLDMDRVLAAEGGLIDALRLVAQDYGNWDDTCAFLAAPNESYIQTNFADATFLNLKLNLVLLADASGRVVYSRGFDLEGKVPRPASEQWIDLFRLHGFIGRQVRDGDPGGLQGLLLTDEGPLMVAVKPVLTSEARGPARGVLVMARLLSAGEVASIGQLTLLSVRWLSLEDLPVDIGQVDTGQPSPDWGVPVLVRPLAGGKLEGLSLARDMSGAPIGSWRIEMSRDASSKGWTATAYFLAVMVAGGIAFTVCLVFILERVVLGRLSRLSTQVKAIALENDPSGRVEEQGADEIGELSTAINGMLEGLERSAARLAAMAGNPRAAQEQARQADGGLPDARSRESSTPPDALDELPGLARPGPGLGDDDRSRMGGPTWDLPPLDGVDMDLAGSLHEGDRERFLKMLGRFAVEHSDACAQIGRLLERGDFPRAWTAAHGLKGSASGIAALQAAELAASLEEAIHAQDAESANMALAELDAFLIGFLARVDEYCARHTNNINA